jgi:hypothetical protein
MTAKTYQHERLLRQTPTDPSFGPASPPGVPSRSVPRKVGQIVMRLRVGEATADHARSRITAEFIRKRLFGVLTESEFSTPVPTSTNLGGHGDAATPPQQAAVALAAGNDERLDAHYLRRKRASGAAWLRLNPQ